MDFEVDFGNACTKSHFTTTLVLISLESNTCSVFVLTLPMFHAHVIYWTPKKQMCERRKTLVLFKKKKKIFNRLFIHSFIIQTSEDPSTWQQILKIYRIYFGLTYYIVYSRHKFWSHVMLNASWPLNFKIAQCDYYCPSPSTVTQSLKLHKSFCTLIRLNGGSWPSTLIFLRVQRIIISLDIDHFGSITDRPF